MRRNISTVAIVVTVALLLTTVAAPFAAAQSNTTTQEQTSDQTTCEVSANDQLLSQTRLYAPQKTITANEEGQIAGGFQVNPSNECPVVVNINLQVPSGMSIRGASDAWSTGAGMTSAQFVVQPNGGIKDVRAAVFSENTGQRTVTADITYWPEGHKDLAKEIDGIQLTFTVEAPNESETSGGETDGESIIESIKSFVASNPFLIIGILAVLLVVSLLTRRTINIENNQAQQK